jgi:ProP effector
MSVNRTIANETIALLVQKFPAAFSLFGPRRPLKVRIHADILAAAPDLSTRSVKVALACYTHHRNYLAAMVAGAARVGLDGAPVDSVDEAGAAHAIAVAQEQLERRRVRDRARTAAAKGQAAAIAKAKNAATSKPEQKTETPKPPAKPLQLSLSGLRESARRRAASIRIEA